MSMTKAEKARVEELERDLAFRWPTQAEPDRLPSAASGETIEGWDYNAYAVTVEKYWSTSVSHGRAGQNRTLGGSQNGKRLYATEAEAYLGLRWALCRQYAAELRKVDLRAVAVSA